MTNKTPIQDLIDYCVNNKHHHHCDSIHSPIEYLDYKDIIGKLSRVLEKEKAFAFDCLESGYWAGRNNDITLVELHDRYAEKHTN